MNKITDSINLACAKIAIAKIDMQLKLQSAWRDDRGVTAIEYGLISALIAVVIIIAVTSVGTELKNTFNTVSSHLQDANSLST